MRTHDKHLRLSAGMLTTILVVHLISVRLKLYWTWPWLDVPVHFFTGMALAILAVWLSCRFSKPLSMGVVVLAASCIGLGWEGYQVVVAALLDAPLKEHYLFDTTTDLVVGVAGASLGYMLARRRVGDGINQSPLREGGE